MPLQRLAQEPLSGCEVAALAEPEFYRVTVAVDGAVQVHPTSSDLDIGFIDVPSPRDGSLPLIEALQGQWRVMHSPAMDGRVIDSDAALGHHLFEISQAQVVG